VKNLLVAIIQLQIFSASLQHWRQIL